MPASNFDNLIQFEPEGALRPEEFAELIHRSARSRICTPTTSQHPNVPDAEKVTNSKAETWAGLLRRQHGVFAEGQADAHGLSPEMLRQREDAGLYRTVAPHTMYVAGALELPPEARLWRAVLTMPTAVISHTTAARLWELRIPPDDTIHITVPRKTWLPREGFQTHTVTSLARHDRRIRCGLPVTALERSLIDAFGILDSKESRRTLVADAIRERRTTFKKMSRAVLRISQLPRRGELFEALELSIGGSHSAGEMKVYEFLLRWSLPPPERQHTLVLPGRRRHVDCALAAYRIAIEYDGRHHLTDTQRLDDQLRDEALRRQSWITIRVSERRLRDEVRLAKDIWANIVEQAARLDVELPPAPRRD